VSTRARIFALLPLAALGVHQLRYQLAFGNDSHHELAVQGLISHVAGLALAHDRALAVYGDPERASRSQRWMLLVMISFTCLGLFLLSQPNQ
jgi:hypothetical protein